MRDLFVVDAETDGLYGKFLSVAALITNCEGKEIAHFYGAIETKAEEIESRWVLDNVVPHLKNADLFFKSEYDLLEAFWAFWSIHRDNCDCIAFVPYPVETRLFTKCVEHALHEREFCAPFPLYDLSVLLRLSGHDPTETDLSIFTGKDAVTHDAMNDVRRTEAAWRSLIRQFGC